MSDEQKYRVTRMCCTSGQCIDCHSAGGRTRVIHADNVSKELAEKMLVGWRDYKPVMAPVEPEDVINENLIRNRAAAAVGATATGEARKQRTAGGEEVAPEEPKRTWKHSGTSGSGEGY